jgi:hypothetical protein
MATTTQEMPRNGEGSLVQQYLEEARRVEEARRSKKKYRNVEAAPFWPHEAIRGTTIVLAFSAAILFSAALMPYFLEKPANPAGQPEVILPDWYLLWSYGLLKPGVADPVTFNGTPIQIPILYQIEDALGPLGDTQRGEMNAKTMGILLNMIIMIPLVALPFLSTGHPRRPQESPLLAAFGCAGIVYVFNISVYAVNNVIFSKGPLAWWGKGLLELTPVVGYPAAPGEHLDHMAANATWLNILGGFAFWVLLLPIASFVVRRYALKESLKHVLLVCVAEVVILVTIIAYAAGLDLVSLLPFHWWPGSEAAGNPKLFFATALANSNLLSWIVWWSTRVAFEVSFWALTSWKRWGQRAEHYEHDLNLTYYKVR